MQKKVMRERGIEEGGKKVDESEKSNKSSKIKAKVVTLGAEMTRGM